MVTVMESWDTTKKLEKEIICKSVPEDAACTESTFDDKTELKIKLGLS